MQKLLIVFFLFLTVSLHANNEVENEKSFNAVEFIFEHVNDSHEWHFFSIGNTHVTLPLPVILYSEHSGWHFFFSSDFHHQRPGFNFEIAGGVKDAGKILEKLPDGSTYVPYDFSITKTVVAILMAVSLLLVVIFKAKKEAVTHSFHAPKGVQNLVEALVVFVRDEVAKPFAGKEFERFLPFLLTLFFFILVSNLIGLVLPLGLNITGNIAVTLVLALFTFVITTVNGTKRYWAHIFNPEVPWFMKYPIPLIPFIEFVGIFIKPVILMIRLFANMFSGHMIVAVLIALIFLMSSMFNVGVGAATSVISVVFSLFMMIVDILVSFIQAYIFTLLSAMYFGMATEKSKH